MGRLTNWLATAFGAVPPGEMGGIQLEGSYWEVQGARLAAGPFFLALDALVPEGSFLCLEGGAHPAQLRRFLDQACVSPQQQVARGTAWPRAVVFDLPASSVTLQELARLAEACANPEVCDHLHVYDEEGVLLQWFDAFMSPLFVSSRVSRERVASFCEALNVNWTQPEPTVPQ